jgi:Family of unknown function (DUF6064)
MQMPFSAEQFFGVFRLYNSSVWPAQVLLLALAVLAVLCVALRRPWSSGAVSGILASFWIWLGAAHHLVCFARINPVAHACGGLAGRRPGP